MVRNANCKKPGSLISGRCYLHGAQDRYAKRKLALITDFVLILAAWGHLVSADEVVTFEPQTTQSTFFSDDEVSFRLNLNSEQAIDGRVTWQLSSLHRGLARGEVAVKAAAAKPRSITLRLPMPHIKDGVIQPAVLSASFNEAGNQEPSATYRRELWVFSADPFVDRTHWIEQLQLQLFDPVGKTTKIFESAGIPCEEIRSVAGLQAIESGIVIVAEGVNRTAIAETLVSLAAAGRRVLWFAPEQCAFDLPGSDQFVGKRPKQILLSGSNRIEQLDKRLDPHVWADAESAKSVSLNIVAEGNRTLVKIGPPREGWVWLQAEYSDPDGQLILCGLGLVDCWDATPTPRFMLARLLEQLDNTDQSTEVIEE